VGKNFVFSKISMVLHEARIAIISINQTFFNLFVFLQRYWGTGRKPASFLSGANPHPELVP
jgi:hypothetical protein